MPDKNSDALNSRNIGRSLFRDGTTKAALALADRKREARPAKRNPRFRS